MVSLCNTTLVFCRYTLDSVYCNSSDILAEIALRIISGYGSALSNMVAIAYLWLSGPWNVAIATKELNVKI